MFTANMIIEVEYEEREDTALFCRIRSAAADTRGRPAYMCPLKFRHDFSAMVQTALRNEIQGKLKGLEIGEHQDLSYPNPSVTSSSHAYLTCMQNRVPAMPR